MSPSSYSYKVNSQKARKKEGGGKNIKMSIKKSIVLGLALLIVCASVGTVSALDITDQFLVVYGGYVVNPNSVFIDIVNGDNDSVLFGHQIIFNGTSYVEISILGATYYAIGTSDLTGDGIVDAKFNTSKLFTTGVCSVTDGINIETLTVDSPITKLDLKVGNRSARSIPGGTPLRINFETNLDYEDRVDLQVINPDGCMVAISPKGQLFGNINITQLLEYGPFDKSKQIDTTGTGWKMGTYTFQVKTDKENARGLDVRSNKKMLYLTKFEVEIKTSKINPTINETIILTVQGVPYHNISVYSSYPAKTVFEGGQYDYSGPDTGCPINDVMDEDDVKYYAVHFTDTGCYTIFAEDLDEYVYDCMDITVSEPEILKLEVEDDNKIRVNFNTYLLDEDRIDLKIINPEGATVIFNPANPSQVFCNITVQAVKNMLINTNGWDFGIYTTWIETNKSYIPVLDVHSNPVVFEISEAKVRMVPTVFFFDYDPPYQGEDGGVLTVGDDMLFYGTATGNSTMGIAINDKIVKTNILIQESGSFVDILPTYNLTPGFKEVEAFIDTPFALDEDVTGIESNGSSNVFLKSNESILSLYGGTVIIGTDLTIHGAATGGTSVDIAIEDEVVAIDVLIAEAGEFEVTLPTPATPHTNTVGVKEVKAFIETPFVVGEIVSEAVSSGDSSVFLVEDVEEGEIGVYAEKNEIAVFKTVRIAVVGTPGHNITVDCSDPTHAEFLPVYDTPWPITIPFTDIIDEDGVRTYGVRFNESGTYTITVTDTDTGNNDSVAISVEEAKVTFNMVSNCTIGDSLLIKGYANTGDRVDIAIEDEVLPSLNDLAIKENGEFSRWVETYYYAAGSIKIVAYIDRALGSGPIGPDEEDNGNTTILLTNPTLSAYLTKNEVTQGDEFRIWGIAPGAMAVDILTVSPRGGNGTGLDGDLPLSPGTSVTGITFWRVSVSESNQGFLEIRYVDIDADSGTYAIIVTIPGPNGTYDGVNDWDLLDGIVNTYCGGNPEVLASMNQEELVEIVKNATVNAPGSDDLLQELHLSVVERVTSFDTGSPTNPYPSIFGTHKGTITPFYNLNVRKIYTYPCPGTGGHTEYVHIYGNGIDKSASWTGYSGDWHNITFPETTLEAGKTYNYTLITGSYPQIIHNQTLTNAYGIINCTKFIDANGKEYNDWIPALRLGG